MLVNCSVHYGRKNEPYSRETQEEKGNEEVVKRNKGKEIMKARRTIAIKEKGNEK
jgi:hypothetical protein